MDRLIADLRKVLSKGERRPLPPPAAPAEPPAVDRLVEIFGHALTRDAGSLVEVSTEAEARSHVAEIATGPVVWAEDDPDDDALRAAAVGVDFADGLIAETGTVVKSYPSRRASRISLVPATSVFIATPDRLVATLPEALLPVAEEHSRGAAYTLLITGPSRTADIEKQLVIPAHGPRELIVVLIR